MQKDRLSYLIDKFEKNKCTEAELTELNNWFHSVQMGKQAMHEWIAVSGGGSKLVNNLFERFSEKVNASRSKPHWQKWVSIAASVLIIATLGLLITDKTVPKVNKVAKDRIVKPGNYATITLEDGRRISLNELSDGKISNTGQADITSLANGKVVYHVQKQNTRSSALIYHTLTTPRGGKYDLVLPDGTEVMIDAASSITYPIAFSGRERVVEIKGQAYFKVIHDEKQPFIVKANGQLLRDIGTEFNVSNYTDENTVKATLVEGSISISNELHTKILRPGQQASVINGQSLINIQRPVMDDVLAWTNGKFTFHHQQVTDILRQAARWYDIEIIYQGPKPTTTFGGTLNRDKDVSELLENLRIIGGIKYKKTGRRIIIMN